MKYLPSIFFALSICLFQNSINAQILSEQKNNAGEEIIYNAYIEQVTKMLGARGMSNDEITEVIEQYKSNKINSDADFAKVFGKLYASDRNIALIFYFFKDDSLRISFFEPGKIIEQQKIGIAENELLQLSIDINQSLNLYNQTVNRAPSLRGVTIKKKETNDKKISFEKTITKASKILLPKAFTKQYKHLIIVPALNISAIPFHLLQPYNDTTFLVQHCSYSIAPSIVDLIVLRYKMLKNKLLNNDFNYIQQLFSATPNAIFNESRKNAILHKLELAAYPFENPLFVSNPTYPTNTAYIFPDLPGAKKEIDNAKKYAIRYKLFTGNAAIKDSILQYLSNADVAYFATHGIASNDNPMEKSFLVLSGSNAFLTAKDIMDTRLKRKSFPEMVILSACQTGLGKFMNAGTVGLARSFLIAGSNHVIMSLWNVDDEATAFLMNKFVGYLQNNTNHLPSGALRLAILDTKLKYPNPSKWASFAMFGVDY